MNQNRQLTSEEKDMVGTYEHKNPGYDTKYVLLEDGIAEFYNSDAGIVPSTDYKFTNKKKWSIVDNKLHIADVQGMHIDVYRINQDNSLTKIAYIENGKRSAYSQEKQLTYKKIK